MPKVITPEREIAILAAIAEFDNPAEWRTSAKGSLYRMWAGSGEDRRVTIFRRPSGRYAFCIAGGDDGPAFSADDYKTVADAKGGLRYALFVGEAI